MLPSDALLTGARFPDLDRSPRLRELSRAAAAQQPSWQDHPDLACIRAELADLPALVSRRDLWALRGDLAGVAAGGAHLLHVGECAELFAMATPDGVRHRADLYRALADRLAGATGWPVVLVARMAGQYAKPRSGLLEVLPDGTEIPVYRGDAVNGPDPVASVRRPDPWRLLTSYDRSRDTLALLAGTGIHVSHEALLKDYEEPLTRGGSMPYAGSGHLLWIGERTRHHDDWHVRWASSLANPVAVKIGPTATADHVARLVRALEPEGRPGRLSLILRVGAPDAVRRLDRLVGAVVGTGVPVVWQCDPMHGNTLRAPGGKTRLLPDITAEVSAFVQVLRAHGCRPGGLHLEVTPDPVDECREQLGGPAGLGPPPPCDPRLNPAQALAVVDHFAGEVGARSDGGR